MRAALCVAAAAAARAADPCASYTDCASCAGDVSCGWCSRAVVYLDNSTGPRCAGPKTSDPFTCPSIYSTVKCIQGYACEANQCVEQPPGQGDPLADCEKSCSGPAAKVYKCEHPGGASTYNCTEVPVGTAGSTSLPLCQSQCQEHPEPTPPPAPPASVYVCEQSNATCMEVAPGTAGAVGKQLCDEECKPSYMCDLASLTCKEGTGASGDSEADCQKKCRAANDPCMPHYDCPSCIAAGSQCGWCSVNVTYVSGQEGTQCAGVDPSNLPFECPGSYSTDACLETPAPPNPDPCAMYTECNECLNHAGCGWCSEAVTYDNGTKGSQCAGPSAGKFTCDAVYSTEHCLPGYRCDHIDNGTQCTKLPPGQGHMTLHNCNSQCAGPVHPVYLCDPTDRSCSLVPAGTPGSTSKDLCETNCTVPSDDVYLCDVPSKTCKVVPSGTAGATSKYVCMDTCGLWQCDWQDRPNYKCSIGVSKWTEQECTGYCKPPNDPCEAHGGDCAGCLAAAAVCGWCTDAVKYVSGEPGTHCAGVDSGILPFSCTGTYSNTKCPPQNATK